MCIIHLTVLTSQGISGETFVQLLTKHKEIITKTLKEKENGEAVSWDGEEPLTKQCTIPNQRCPI